MMDHENFRRIEDSYSGEKYLEYLHPSGLTVYIYPRELTTAYAMLSTKYGALDRCFRSCDGKTVTVPDGVAHFLEHKMFEEEDGSDAFEKFAAIGANANAYTSHEMTSYLFSATEHVAESLEVLLSFVAHPHFTEENVAKEQGIIGQEISMYDDRPASRLYYATLEALYKRHNIRVNIAGTKETISQITPEILYTCYNTFYQPANMILAVSGKIDCEDVIAIVDRVFGTDKREFAEIERIYPEEETSINERAVSFSMSIANPMFSIGVKDVQHFDSFRERVRHALQVNILLKLLFSRSSAFFNRLYDRSLVTDSVDAFFETMDSCAYMMIAGESESADEVLEEIEKTLRRIPLEWLTEEDFLRVKRVMYADNIRVLDSTESIASEITDAALHGLTLWEMSDILREITFSDILTLAAHYFEDKEFVRVVILPQA